MVLSLFATLLARLWYIQVVGEQTYQAAAVSNSVRDVDIAAPRGLIVDDQGRPLVANRTSWVVTVDRSVLRQARHLDPQTRRSPGSPASSGRATPT